MQNSSVFKALSWIQYISPIRYAFEGLSIAEFAPRHLQVVYEVKLGFDGFINYTWCCIFLALLSIVARSFAIVMLSLNVTKVQ